MSTRSDGRSGSDRASRLLAAALCAGAAAALAACASPVPPAPEPPRPHVDVETLPPDPAPTDAVEVLDRALSGEDRSGGGSGPLTASIGNTLQHDGPDETMSFVFACTGPGTVTLTFKNLDDDTPGTFRCGDGIFQQSVTVTPERTVSFAGTVTDPADGTYAYAWLTDSPG